MLARFIPVLLVVVAWLYPIRHVSGVEVYPARTSHHEHAKRSGVCERDPDENFHSLARRATVGGDVSANVSLPHVGLSLGNISTKLGNINLTVTNVTISVGDINVEDISVGNITVIVSVPLPGASPVNAFSAYQPGSSITTSTAGPTSTVSPGTSITQTSTTIVNRRGKRDTTTSDGIATSTSTSAGVGGTVGVGGNPITLDTGNVITEIGNISIFVGNVNVSVGSVTIKNVTIGNIFVLVKIGQPDLAGIVGNVTNTLNGGIGALPG